MELAALGLTAFPHKKILQALLLNVNG